MGSDEFFLPKVLDSRPETRYTSASVNRFGMATVIQERSHSGLVQVFAKHPGCNSPRGFDSRPLRPSVDIYVCTDLPL